MIAPQLATMLCVITTDAVVCAGQLQAALTLEWKCRSTASTLTAACPPTTPCFCSRPVPPVSNRITTSSTSWCVRRLRLLGPPDHRRRRRCLPRHSHHRHRCHHEDAALACGRAVAASNLLKCAISGNDPNWGRIVSSLGTVPPEVAPYDSNKVTVDVNGVRICENGGAGRDRARST